MPESLKIAALEEEIAVRNRTILFLLSEFVTRHREDQDKIIAFMEDVLPDLAPPTAGIARELLAHIRSI